MAAKKEVEQYIELQENDDINIERAEYDTFSISLKESLLEKEQIDENYKNFQC